MKGAGPKNGTPDRRKPTTARSAPTGRGPRTIDLHVGERIRQRRVMLGLSQHDLADVIGVTYQQLHKYERGLNRIAASRLSQVAEVLRVEVGYFFEGARTPGTQGLSDRQRMLLDLARNFAAIESDRLQKAVCALVRSLAEHPDQGSNGDGPTA